MTQRAVLVFFLLLPTLSFGQHQIVDSLEMLVNDSSLPDTLRVSRLNQLVRKIREQDSKRALYYARKAKSIAETVNNPKQLCHALENLGWVYYRLGDYSQAFELSGEALKISEEINDDLANARCLINIAAINYEQKQFALAIEKFKKSYVISSRHGDYLTVARSLNNIAYSFLGLRQLDSARVYAEQAMTMGEKSNNPYMIGFALRTLGDIDLEYKRFDRALERFNEALSLAGDLKNTFLEVSTLHRIGKLYWQRKKSDLALPYLLKNVALSKEYGYREEMERTYKLLSEVYASRKDLAKAFYYQNQYLIVHDSLHNQRNSEQMTLMQARFDSEMKEAKIELLTKEGELKEKEINSQQVWTYFYVGCLTLLLLLAFVLFYNNQIKKRINEELAAKNKKIQKQARQLRNLNSTKDKLFSIISHDLRSPLNSLRGLMDLIGVEGLSQEEFIVASQQLRANLDLVHEDLDNLLYWAQSQLKGLQVNMEPVALNPVVEEKIRLFADIASGKGVTIVNSIDPELVVSVDRNHLQLIIRNLMANAIKFNGDGGFVYITQASDAGRVEISVTDSGVGMSSKDLSRLFNAETHFTNPGTNQEKGTGLGLLITKEFVEKNGGTIRATSELGKGSTFTFTLQQMSVSTERKEVLSPSL